MSWNTDKPYDRDVFLPRRREQEDVNIDQIADEQERKEDATKEIDDGD